MKITTINNHTSFNSNLNPPIYNVNVDTNKIYTKTEAIDCLLDEWDKAKTQIKLLETEIAKSEKQTPKDTKKLLRLNYNKAFWVQLQIALEQQIEVMRKAPDDQKMKIRLVTNN